MTSPAAYLSLIAVLLVAPASAQVSCDGPDSLCAGDPCVTTVTAVRSPCVVDFGDRALVIRRRLRLPDGGVLQLTARDVAVKGSLAGNGAHGASIALIATHRIDQRGRIDVSGTAQAGTILLQAGDDIALDGRVRSVAASGSGVSGGTVAFDAGGWVTCSARCGVDVRGNGPGAGGQAFYRGAAGVDLVGHLVAEGGIGPHLEFTSSAGAVTVGTDIRMRATLGAGGYILLAAATVANITRTIEALGATTGGTIQLSAPTVVFTQGARAPGAAGGQVEVTAGTVRSLQPIEANGDTSGGLIEIAADAMMIDSSLRATGGDQGGRISLVASTGDLRLNGIFDVRRGGGVFEASAARDLVVSGQLHAAGGCIALAAGGVLDTSGVRSATPFQAGCP